MLVVFIPERQYLMRNEVFIAQRLYYAKTDKDKQVSLPAIRVALTAIIVGMVVMIITVFVVVGFKQEIQRKVAGFGSDIQIVNFDNNNTYEMQPICVGDSLFQEIGMLDGVEYAQRFATKPGMLKTDSSFQGIIFKGMPLPNESTTKKKNGWTFFEEYLAAGHLPQQKNEVIISTTMSRLLDLGVGDSFYAYFIEEQIRARKLLVAGLYNTQFSDYDKSFVLGDIQQVQTLNNWRADQVSGIDIQTDDFSQLGKISDEVWFRTANKADEDGNFLYTQNIIDMNPNIFSWLELLNVNVVVIIILMLCVAGFNIISGLLILILDAVQLIGILKALGADNGYLRRIFLYRAGFLILNGMLWGNIAGLLLCAVQYFFHVIPLDPTAYYVSYVPIAFHWGWWTALNIGTFAVSMLILLAPSAIITRISPAKVMHFE
ncbi:MAG TPA: ABC transporter permease [Bacteroidales bacterium]|nr:ABC transporter permease [Bacteroidales bacterium]